MRPLKGDLKVSLKLQSNFWISRVTLYFPSGGKICSCVLCKDSENGNNGFSMLLDSTCHKRLTIIYYIRTSTDIRTGLAGNLEVPNFTVRILDWKWWIMIEGSGAEIDAARVSDSLVFSFNSQDIRSDSFKIEFNIWALRGSWISILRWPPQQGDSELNMLRLKQQLSFLRFHGSRFICRVVAQFVQGSTRGLSEFEWLILNFIQINMLKEIVFVISFRKERRYLNKAW